MPTDYRVITGKKAAALKSWGQRTTKMDLLRAGEVLFVPGRKFFGGWRTYLSNEGYDFHQKLGEENGEQGSYIWATPR